MSRSARATTRAALSRACPPTDARAVGAAPRESNDGGVLRVGLPDVLDHDDAVVGRALGDQGPGHRRLARPGSAGDHERGAGRDHTAQQLGHVGRDRPERVLGLLRVPHLAHHERVERGIEGARHLGGHRHATAGEPVHHDRGGVRAGQDGAEAAPRVGAVTTSSVATSTSRRGSPVSPAPTMGHGRVPVVDTGRISS